MTSFDPQDPASVPDAEANAALHAVGALDAEAAAALEARLDGDRALEAEFEANRAVVGELALLAPATPPPDDLWQRTLARVRATAAQHEPSTPFAATIRDVHTSRQDNLSFLFRDVGDFTPLPVTGISARTLHRDDAAGYATVLVRMAAGAAYPAHRHGDDEECYVLEGELQVGDVTMRAGDYQLAGRGTVHPVQSTRSGCLLLLRSSLRDELIEAC